jgi:hypothetical protein
VQWRAPVSSGGLPRPAGDRVPSALRSPALHLPRSIPHPPTSRPTPPTPASHDCCPLSNGVGCADNAHCCPGDKPVCDTAQGVCWSEDGKESAPWVSKDPATLASSPEEILAPAAAAAEAGEGRGVSRRRSGGGDMKAGGLSVQV